MCCVLCTRCVCMCVEGKVSQQSISVGYIDQAMSSLSKDVERFFGHYKPTQITHTCITALCLSIWLLSPLSGLPRPRAPRQRCSPRWFPSLRACKPTRPGALGVAGVCTLRLSKDCGRKMRVLPSTCPYPSFVCECLIDEPSLRVQVPV